MLLGRSKAEQCKTLLDMISEGRAESAVTHFSIHSVETIMRKKAGELTSFLRALDQTVGLYVFRHDVGRRGLSLDSDRYHQA